MKIKKWRRYLPNIGLWISIPFIEITTYMLRESFNDLTVDWFLIDVKIWKWKFTLRLYYKPTF